MQTDQSKIANTRRVVTDVFSIIDILFSPVFKNLKNKHIQFLSILIHIEIT